MRASPTLSAATTYGSNTGNAIMLQGGAGLNGWLLESASPTSVSARGSANTGVSQGLRGRAWLNVEL